MPHRCHHCHIAQHRAISLPHQFCICHHRHITPHITVNTATSLPPLIHHCRIAQHHCHIAQHHCHINSASLPSLPPPLHHSPHHCQHCQHCHLNTINTTSLPTSLRTSLPPPLPPPPHHCHHHRHIAPHITADTATSMLHRYQQSSHSPHHCHTATFGCHLDATSLPPQYHQCATTATSLPTLLTPIPALPPM